MTVLEVSGLDVDLGGRRVLRDVGFRLDRGEFVALVGPNGAGKTTLVRSVLSLIRIRSGQILIDGRPAQRRGARIGYVPQRHEFAWDFPISVENAVMTGRNGVLPLWRRPGLDDWRIVRDCVDRVELGDLRTRPVGELSGGQRQRVLVARALASQPSTLLLDEPFTGLDLPTQEMLAALFAELASEGSAVLMTTHDLLGAMQGCSRLLLLDGTIVADGAPRQLLDPELWMRTFGVGPTSPLLRILEAV